MLYWPFMQSMSMFPYGLYVIQIYLQHFPGSIGYILLQTVLRSETAVGLQQANAGFAAYQHVLVFVFLSIEIDKVVQKLMTTRYNARLASVITRTRHK